MSTAIRRQIGLQILCLRRHATVALNAMLAPLGACAPMYTVLFRLANDGALSQHELISDTALDPAGVSRMIARLAKEGLIRSEVDPADKRVKKIHITVKGERLEEGFVARQHHRNVHRPLGRRG